MPERFRFDLASLPREAWPLIAPFELSIAAPLLRDYLYRSGGAPAGFNPLHSAAGTRYDLAGRGSETEAPPRASASPTRWSSTR